MGKNRRGGREAHRRVALDVRTVLREAIDDDPDFDPFDCLQSIAAATDDPGAELARLAAYDLDPKVSGAAIRSLVFAVRDEDDDEEDEEEDVLAEDLGIDPQQFRQGALPVLLAALRDSGLPDDRKYRIYPVYMLSGGEDSGEPVASFFKDFQGTMERALGELADTLDDSPESVARMLFGAQFLTDDGEPPTDGSFYVALRMARMLAASAPAAAATALCTSAAVAVEHGLDAQLAEEAVEAAADTRTPQAAWCLAELARWPATGPLGGRARLLAQDLRNSVDLACPAHGRFSHGSVTQVDGAGSRMLSLFFEREDDDFDAVLLLLSDVVGVKDVWCMFGNAEEVVAAVEPQGEECHEPRRAPCGLPLARKLLADAWATHVANGAPMPGRLFLARIFLGHEAIEPARHTPDLTAYRLGRMRPRPELARGSEALGEHPSLTGLLFTSDQAYAYVAENAPERRRRLSRAKFQTFCRRIAPLERDLFLSRVATNLEVEALAGRAGEPLNRTAAKVWLTLSHDAVPFHAIPFIQTQCERSIEVIIDNVRLGYRTQAEANRAALEFDEHLAELFDDPEGPAKFARFLDHDHSDDDH